MDSYFFLSVSANASVHSQVNGSILQFMTDPEDVLEYVEGTVKKIRVRLLLKWLRSVHGSRSPSITALEVGSSVAVYSCSLSQFS